MRYYVIPGQTFAAAYGTNGYGSCDYSTGCAAASGSSANGSSTGNGSLVNTGVAVAGLVTLACLLIFAALLVRFWRRPSKPVAEIAESDDERDDPSIAPEERR